MMNVLLLLSFGFCIFAPKKALRNCKLATSREEVRTRKQDLNEGCQPMTEEARKEHALYQDIMKALLNTIVHLKEKLQIHERSEIKSQNAQTEIDEINTQLTHLRTQIVVCPQAQVAVFEKDGHPNRAATLQSFIPCKYAQAETSTSSCGAIR